MLQNLNTGCYGRVGSLFKAGVMAGFVVVGACSKPAPRPETDPGPERVAIPMGAAAGSGMGGGGSARGEALGGGSAATGAQDARFHLQPAEGTLTIENAEGKAGSQLVGSVVVTPAPGLHIATDFPIKVTLVAPPGVKLAKTELSAGGAGKSIGDASALSEQRLGFAVAATAEKAGVYEITGMFKFGICEKDSCHPKRQPIAISMTAN